MPEHEIEPIRVTDEWEMDYLQYHVYFAIGFHEEMGLWLGMWCQKGCAEFFRHGFNYQPTRDEVEGLYFQKASYNGLPRYPRYNGEPIGERKW